jgi:ribonuclease/clavin/mitogillin
MSAIAQVPVTVRTRAEAGRTNAYLVGRDPAVLVDPAAASDELRAAAERRGVGDVLVTHTHPDHVGAVGDFADGATVWARRGRCDEFVAATGVDPDRTLGAGSTVAAGDGTTLTAVDTPGHAPDHLAFGVGGAVLTGDLVIADGSVVVGAPDGDMRAYLTSLRRLYARDPDRLYPGHGDPVDDPRAEVERLLAHRLRRERRVRDAVHRGARTVEEVVDAAYEKDLGGVRDLARATVVAHLEKLAVEGQVRWDGERAHPS